MIRIFKDTKELGLAAAELFVESAQKAITEKGKFTVALTGGSSPAYLYELLASENYRNKVDWKNTFVFWGDERWVPIDDSKSNAGMAQKVLLDKVDLPKSQIFPMWKQNSEPKEYAKQYSTILKIHLGESGQFDLILSGMGDDGHTASLFPGTQVLDEKVKWVDAYYLEPQSMFRITLTAPLINKAKRNIVLAFGANKANALTEVLSGDKNIQKYPSQLLQPSDGGELIWLIDEAAAVNLPSEIKSIKK